MRYRNYKYDVIDEEIVITEYVPDPDPDGDGNESKQDASGDGNDPGGGMFGDGNDPGWDMFGDANDPGQNANGGANAPEQDTSACIFPEGEEPVTDDLPGITLRIPSHIGGLPVTEIGEEAFSENGAQIDRTELPPTIRRIGKGAFRMCISLTELLLPEGLERIGPEAFFLTPLEELVLPASLKEIENPWELATIRFRVAEGNPYFFTDGFCLYRREGEEKELLVARQTEERTEYKVLDGTTAIGENAMSGNGTLRKVILPQSMYMIGEAAFEGCQNLSQVVLPEGIRRIGAHAFSHCICLKHLYLPASVAVIGRCALSDTFGWSEDLRGLEYISVAAGNNHFMADADALFEIGMNADRYLVKYFGTGREYRIPGDVSRILPGAFRRSGLRRCIVPASVRDVGEDAFRECRDLEEILLEETGTALFVPAQPVYRKDEVTQLFYSSERMSRQEELKETEPFEMPEYWKDFAHGTVVWPKKNRPDAARYAGYVYDYRGYDALFESRTGLRERCGIACCRLKYPVLLNAAAAERYRAYVGVNLTDILHDLQKMQDFDLLVLLAELGFFTSDNIEESIGIFGRSGQAEFTGYLLNYKKEYLEEKAFDFSL
ncbi:MAG: leucine-rich repeat domain-containing protein [Lachnospiraceae bacterium]|nr:leucine-rich repeat domain-containing protein [Lachnospiraceae bacterium]